MLRSAPSNSPRRGKDEVMKANLQKEFYTDSPGQFAPQPDHAMLQAPIGSRAG